ncbi:hypothetical protein BGL_1c16830 [Burkholderia plantarii]|uniref:Uncharacterized protein n=1 Tax=Burkholderia plantarii TaxID=41899 RepID=A0A0B6RLI1_BURPL|nr:hypothetical protein BGL_1c16830 [Burkholderia plantarii]
MDDQHPRTSASLAWIDKPCMTAATGALMKYLCERLARWARGHESGADPWCERFKVARSGDTIFLEVTDRSRVKPGYIEGLTKYAEMHGIQVLLLIDGVRVAEEGEP